MDKRRSLLGTLIGTGCIASIAFVSASCRGATQITIDIRTNVPCGDPAGWQGVAVYSGAPGLDVETKDPSLTAAACGPDGHVGSIVLVPKNAKDATVGIRVVAGLTRPPDQCAAAAYQGCIVARRTVTFLPHEALDLTVELTRDCVGDACDPLRTCVNGSCVDSRLTSTPTGTPDAAGATDAAVAAATVRCGDDPTNRCPANDVDHACCVTVASGKIAAATCKRTVDCATPSFSLLCEKSSDCAGRHDDAGLPFVCCVTNVGPLANSECTSFEACDLRFGYRSFLCNDQQACTIGGEYQCRPRGDDLPGYYGCDTL